MIAVNTTLKHTRDRRRNLLRSMRQVIGAGLLGVSILAGCSNDMSQSTLTIAPSTINTHPSTSAISSVESTDPQDLRLTCEDSGRAGSPPPERDLTVRGLSFGGIAATGEAIAGYVPITADGREKIFVKVFIYVGADAAAQTTITIVKPSDARVWYVDASAWNGKLPSSIEADSGRSVTLDRCADALDGYFGGILANAPTCATLRISSAVQRDTDVDISVGGATC